MKNVSLLIGLVFLTAVLSAQDYVPLIDTNRVWSHYTYFPHGGFGAFTHYKIGNDTIIDGEIYHRVLDAIFPDFDNWRYRNYTLRETANGEVFRRGPGAEKLIYDFSLNEGDSFYTGGSMGGQPLYAEVVTVDSILINGSYRKRIIFDDWFDENWIEGIGSSVSPFFPFDNIYTTILNFLVCVHEYGSLVYENPDSWYSCSIVGVCQTEMLSGFKLYPNPARDQVILELTDGMNEQFEIKMFDSRGVEIRNDRFNGSRYILSGDGLPHGLYFVVVYSNDQSFTRKVLFH
jgi:hypothetical protein